MLVKFKKVTSDRHTGYIILEPLGSSQRWRSQITVGETASDFNSNLGYPFKHKDRNRPPEITAL